jgi:hypothetical protein
MKANFIILILLLSSFKQTISQNLAYAKTIINTVCSEKYHGRSYDFGSDKPLAEYIVEELKANKVKPYKKSYYQDFSINYNSLSGNNLVKINSSTLKPGEDYIISSFSSSVSGKYPVITLDKKIIDDSVRYRELIKQDFSEKIILIDTAGIKRKDFIQAYELITIQNYLKAKAIIRIEDKNLIFYPSQIANEFTLISISRNCYKETINSVELDIQSRYIKSYQTQNVIGYLKGETDTCLVLTAHYDHIGCMGYDTYFPGANDNASGIAMVLNLAKMFSEQKKLKYSVMFIFFSGEELGLLGSKYYTENPLFPLSKIKFMINLDMVGSGDQGIKVVNGTIFKKEFDRLTKINNENNYLPDVKIRGAAANSDHYFFYVNGVKSFFIYTLGTYKEYHNIYDKPENLPLTEFEDLLRLIFDFENSF